MSKKVYAVSSGSYSDYSIRAIFSTREKAQACVDWLRAVPYPYAEINDIEEWDVDAGDVPPDFRDIWYVNITLRGDVIECRREGRSPHNWPPSESPPRYHAFPHKNPDHLEVHVHADDGDHALKIAVECLQEWRAKTAGVA